MKPSTFKLASLASAMVLMCATGSAQAGAYALSSLNIQNFTITPSNGSVVFGQSVDTSGASAKLNGVNVGGTGTAGVSDAPVATLGNPIVGENAQFAGNVNTPIGPIGNYSYADALITHLPLGVFNAQTIAESHLSFSGNAGGTSTNSSATSFTVDFTVVGGPASITFDFFADPLIRTFLQPDSGVFAQGVLQASLTITCRSGACGASGTEVFTWSPNGTVTVSGIGGSIGGTETADAENLNTTISNFNPPGGASNYSDGLGLLNYHSFTNALSAGVYSLSLAMTTTDTTVKAVPEPATIGLLGLGLAGLGLISRRRKA